MEPLPHPSSVGGASSQIGAWGMLIDRLCDMLETEDLRTIMFGIERDDDDDEDEIGMEEFQDEDPPKKVIKKFREKMTKGKDHNLKAARLRDWLYDLDYYENGVKMGDIVEEFLQKYSPEPEIKAHEIFVGREGLVEDIVNTFKPEKSQVKCVNLCGIGGQGKTTLARHVLERLNWVTYKTRDKRWTSDLIKELLMAGESDKIFAESEIQLIEEFKTFLMQLKSRTLFFVDDCDNILSRDGGAFHQFLDKILSFINDNPHIKAYFLITSRMKLNTKSLKVSCKFVRQIDVDPLKIPDAIELLCKASGKEIDHILAEEIVKESECSPLAVSSVAELLKQEKFTVERLLFHLKMDKKNVTKAIKMDNLMKTSIDYLNEAERESLVRLIVFQTSSFDLQSAIKVSPRIQEGVLSMDTTSSITHLQALCNLHLLEYESNPMEKRNRTESEAAGHFHLQPLVYKYLQEWRKPKNLDKAVQDATRRFVELYEEKIATLVWNMDTMCVKAVRFLELQRNHIMNFFSILENQKPLLQPYPKMSRPKEFLKKKRVSDLADLLLPDVQKRRLFKSEAARAKDSCNDAMFIFWTVEEADVYTMLCDKPCVAIDLLDGLSQGKYPSLRNLHADKFYPHLVHALFHKVKGLTRWKQRKPEEGLEHLHLALKFFDHFNPDIEQPSNKNYINLHARVFYYIGQIHIELERYQAAEEALTKGYNMVRKNVLSRKESRDMQWDIPRYLGLFGLLKLKKAQREGNAEEKKKILDAALVTLNQGMDLDRKLKLENLDGFNIKLVTKADVFVEKGKYDAALNDAEAALNSRRGIVQPPHFKYAESVHQVARISLLKGKELRDRGNTDEAKKWFMQSSSIFEEMEEHHLVNGSIEVGHPLYWKIKQDHFDARRLYEGDNSAAVKELEVFYKKLEKGCFDGRAKSHLESFKSMLQTPKEFIQKVFGSGGTEFGEKEVVMQAREEFVHDQIHQMVDGRYGVDRKDSGLSSTSSDIGNSTSSSDGCGSLSQHIRHLQMEKSVSLEDTVFESSGETHGNTTERKQIKRQKTVEEAQ